MRVWLTALFVLVTAVAAVTAYEIVRPIMERSLKEASKTSFLEVGNQFEDQVQQLATRRGPNAWIRIGPCTAACNGG
jgi:hypothetical protein